MKSRLVHFCVLALARRLGLLIATLVATTCVGATPHRYDHIVIVVEENRTLGEIIGDTANAPYLNQLANGGVWVSNMYALVHPSQPNYLHLFSGDNQGVTDDNLPPNFSTTPTSTYPFITPNMGAELIAAGFTFAGFSEQLELATTNDWADFDPHTATFPGVDYRRKHNPWANWVAKISPIPANQMSTNVNRAFTQFPSDFGTLPSVCFVIPDQQHDMHNGSRLEGDTWLRDNLNAYAQWAKTNNSLLIVTWDEDDYNSVNRIPTIFYGAGLRNGTVVGGTWTLHNLLRTIEDMYGTTHAGSAAQLRSIVGPFMDDPAVMITSFRQGLGGYTGAQDTQIWSETPAVSYAAREDLKLALDTTSATTGNQTAQGLIRFDSIFGTNAGQIPTNAVIRSAKLILHTPLSSGGTNDSDHVFRAHRMIVDWNDSATWDSVGAGISANGTEAASTATFSLVPEVEGAPAVFDVTSDIELFQGGTPNRGWVIRPSSAGAGTADEWIFKSSEASADPTQRPRLEILYSVPLTPYIEWTISKNLSGANNAPTADPDHDGANNEVEFAYNLNPLVADAVAVTPSGTNGLPAAHYLSQSGGTLEVEFVRRKGTSAAGLTYAVQFSDDLATGWANGQPPTVTSLNSDWERVTVRDNGPGGTAHRFGRVVVGLQQ